ncbi:MAG TPA: LPS export ABC transporter periplasmic protein LptC [Spirochaetaceae bacterium]|nr:LPS export ABC transporter periplasmic protein LptC [Spirochaetaceae bacterium]
MTKTACLSFNAFVLIAFLMLVVSCRGEVASTSEKEPDIRLNGTHCIISESDQEPIVIDADSLELFTDDDTVVMRNARFFQNKKGSSDKNISGKAGYLKLNSRNQDVYLTDKVELFIYPDKDAPVDEGSSDDEETEPEANRILADEIVWGKYSKMLESPQNVLLEWEGTLIRGFGFKGNLNTGEFSFEKVEEGRL